MEIDQKELDKTLENLGKTIDSKLDDFSKKVKDASADDLKKIKAEMKAEMEPILKAYNDKFEVQQKQVDALETKLQRVGGKESKKIVTFSEAVNEVLQTKNFKDLVDKKTRSTGELQLKVGSDMLESNSFESTLVVPATHIPGIIYGPDRRARIRDLIATGTTSSNAVNFVKEYAYNDFTDVTTEGAEKKQADFDLKLATESVRKITAYIMLSEEMLADVEGLMSYISSRLPSKLGLKEDYELLYGTAIAPHLNGIITQSTAYVDALADPGITRLDVLVDACRQVQCSSGSGLNEYQATAILIHPTDATLIKLAKDSTYQYIHPWIFMPEPLTLDGVPIIVSTAITAGQFLVGDFKMGAQVFDRRQASIEISYENEDNFVKDMVTIRIFERLALCVYRPLAFIYGTFSAALAQGSL